MGILNNGGDCLTVNLRIFPLAPLGKFTNLLSNNHSQCPSTLYCWMRNIGKLSPKICLDSQFVLTLPGVILNWKMDTKCDKESTFNTKHSWYQVPPGFRLNWVNYKRGSVQFRVPKTEGSHQTSFPTPIWPEAKQQRTTLLKRQIRTIFEILSKMGLGTCQLEMIFQIFQPTSLIFSLFS